jgi:glycine/D-amino acid oxidase-like deaminating enzyme
MTVPFDSSGVERSYWLPAHRDENFPPLKKDLDVDVLVVGGGIAGLSAALALIKQGKSVALVEDGLIGSGESGRTSAHLATTVDYGYALIAKRFGIDKAKLVADSHIKSVDRIEEIITAEAIDCDFARVNGYLFSHTENISDLEKEAQVLQTLPGEPS